MRVIFRARTTFLASVRQNLSRRHAFADERVGFISIVAANTKTDLVLIAKDYHPVLDEDYVDDQSVGAMMSSEAIRKALNIALFQPVGMLHVHMHGHRGEPKFSKIDLTEQTKFVPDFFKVRPQMPHGAIVLSRDSARGRIWLNPNELLPITEFVVVGPQVDILLRSPGRRIDIVT